MPEPRGHGFIMRAIVDADHASDTVSRQSRTGFLIYLKCALVYWWSNKQTSVESSSFGSEFVAMKQCCEYIRGLRYKLRMMHQHVFMVTINLFLPTQLFQILLWKRSLKVLHITLFVKELLEMNGGHPMLILMKMKPTY